MGKAVSEERLEKLRAMVGRKPLEPFPKYALALEHRNRKEVDEAEVLFAELLESHPEYVPSYFHYGQLLADQGSPERAAEVFRRGIEVAGAQNDDHARSELTAALEALETS